MKGHLLFSSALLGWLAVLMFMIGFGKSNVNFIVAGSVMCIAMAMCLLWLAVIVYDKKNLNRHEE
jgi:hypothetical protein